MSRNYIKSYIYYKLTVVIITSFSASCFGQSQALEKPFNCQLVEGKIIQPCLKAGNNEAVTRQVNAYFDTTLKPGRENIIGLRNYDALRPCDNIINFISYFDSITSTRIIFYPKQYEDSLLSDKWTWNMLGSFLHAMAHLQQDYFEFKQGEKGHIQHELKIDSLTAIRLKSLGATYEQAISHIPQKTIGTSRMPVRDKRIEMYQKVYQQR
ncbi:MAG TPA: hypothetical protein PKC76_09995 [Saprospiraceae bacterium]|nr:hypothetical protein [Saprospiraceae bacterium]HMP24453.1 hypothetical protein [Saprospiraceae bacterium]